MGIIFGVIVAVLAIYGGYRVAVDDTVTTEPMTSVKQVDRGN